jgi:hypothetical protein
MVRVIASLPDDLHAVYHARPLRAAPFRPIALGITAKRDKFRIKTKQVWESGDA